MDRAITLPLGAHVHAQDLKWNLDCGLLIYRRLWLFSAPRQLGAYYYISAYIITVTRPGY